MPLTFARAYFGRTVGELFFGLCKTYYTHSSHSYYNWTYGACQRICCKITKKRVWNYFSVFPVILLSNASLTLTIEHLNQNTDNIWNYFFLTYIENWSHLHRHLNRDKRTWLQLSVSSFVVFQMLFLLSPSFLYFIPAFLGQV